MSTYSDRMKERYNLADDESVLYLFTDASVLITDKRIRKIVPPNNISGFTSLLLEDITSIQVGFDTRIWAIVTGVLLGVAGLGALLEFEAFGLLGLVLSAAFFVYYYQTMESTIEFRSPTAVIKLPTRYLGEESILELIDKIESSKIHNRNTRKE